MTSPVPQIDSPDALLMEVLADELSPADKQVALAQINADPALATQLQVLRQAEAVVQAGLSQLDAATPLPLSAAAAVRQFRQAVEIQRERRIALPPAPSAANRWHVQWWMYPAAAAAVLLLSMMTWWGWHTSDVGILGQTPVAQSTPDSPNSLPNGTSGIASTATPGGATGSAGSSDGGNASVPPPMAIAVPSSPASGTSVVPGSDTPSPSVSPDADDLAGESGIAEAEQQASTLQRWSDPSTITASIFLNDPGVPVE